MPCCNNNNDIYKDDDRYKNTVFDNKQIDSLKRKFNFVSGNQQFITRDTFKKNIGYLGIRAVSTFLDRIFNSFDIDEDNKISQHDFILYMAILKGGSDDQKAKISFNLIYIDENRQPLDKNNRKQSFKNYQSTFHLQNFQSPKKRKKQISKDMFEKFFQDFYKSWSSITNQSIPVKTKSALKTFIQDLYRKVEADSKKAIDLQYYKVLYKDRQFMLAFRQINSKLGNFFIKQPDQFQKNVTIMHKILKKINNLFQKAFPLMNKAFLEETQKYKSKQENQSVGGSPSLEFRNSIQIYSSEQDLDKYYYDAKRYEIQNIFQGGQDVKIPIKIYQQVEASNIPQKVKFIGKKQQKSQNKQNMVYNQQASRQKSLYQSRLESHVAFLQKKLLFLQNSIKQIIQQSKQMYNEMHQQFLKILEKVQRQRYIRQTQIRQFNREKEFDQYKNQKSKQKYVSGQKNNDVNKLKRVNQSQKNQNDKKVFFGDRNFNLVLQIMVGIQMSVRSVSGFQEIIFQEPEDFNLKHTFEMDYGHFGQNDLLYTFTDYAPNVFNHVRKIYEINNENYINSIGPNKMMSSLIMGRMASFEELMSQGKSGSFFYHTQDGKYLIKTISQKQFYFMRKILEKYFRHVKNNPQTLMPRFFGLHKITSTMKKDYSKSSKMVFYLIVMNNFFNTQDSIKDKFDLKGSWVNRENISGVGVKKDLNFIKQNKNIDIGIDTKIKIYQIIQKDSEFFAQNNILDYSLLIGFGQKYQLKKKISRTYSVMEQLSSQAMFMSQQRKQAARHILEEKKSMNFKFQSQNQKSKFYLIGIIDILTQYTQIFPYVSSKKQAEHLFKSCIYDSKGISAVPPFQYKDRFLNFIKKQVFKIDKIKNSKSKSKAKIEPNYQQAKQKMRKSAQSQNDNQHHYISQK